MSGIPGGAVLSRLQSLITSDPVARLVLTRAGRMLPRGRAEAAARIVEDLFDPVYYAKRTGQTAEGPALIAHYLDTGWREGANPSPAFSTRGYLAANPDVRNAGFNPLIHYSLYGMGEGRRPIPVAFHEDQARALANPDADALSALFDGAYYRQQTGMEETDPQALLDLYLESGWKEGIDPSRAFSTRYYLDMNPDVRASGHNPLVHYSLYGHGEGRRPAPDAAERETLEPLVRTHGLRWDEAAAVRRAFDDAYYYKTYPDIAAAGLDPFVHYDQHGWREERDPSPGFSTRFYLTRNPDVRALETNPFVHYCTKGREQGRAGGPNEEFASVDDYASVVLGLTPDQLDILRMGFDEAFYLSRYGDIRDGGIDPLYHYLSSGWRELRDPARDFSTAYYLDTNPDIAAAGLNPFVHYHMYGRAEGRRPRALEDQIQVHEDQINWDAVDRKDVAAIRDHFDADFYLASYPEVADLGIDPVVHYVGLGWLKGYDPTPEFSTRYYGGRYRDIREAGMNPFVHYCRFGREENRKARSYMDAARQNFAPLVSVIVPNYNHAPYLRQRLASIAHQTYRNFELIVLDDVSTDNSREVIREVVADLGIEARLEFNETNSGNVFAQWQKGLSLARGELIWICESDDFCEPDFLEKLVPAFADESVNMAFGRIQFSDADGAPMDGLDAYRENAEAGIWDRPLVRPAAAWFNGGFGVNNMIANVGGSLFRNMPLPPSVWEGARRLRICGDWYLYINILGGGQAAFEPGAVAYFRQHASNTSATNFHNRYYYEENIAILETLIARWGIALDTRQRFLDKVRFQWKHFGVEAELGDFDAVFGTAEILKRRRSDLHVQVYFLGFHTGGGELFPINLANALTAHGYTVSMVAMDLTDVNPDMRARLDRRVAVYDGFHVAERGREAFFEATGASVLHSHIVSADAFLMDLDPHVPVERALVVTLHGSYVALEGASDAYVDRIIRNVTTWDYTADRNLEFFENRELDFTIYRMR